MFGVLVDLADNRRPVVREPISLQFGIDAVSPNSTLRTSSPAVHPSPVIGFEVS
jgi:hypothetical protein